MSTLSSGDDSGRAVGRRTSNRVGATTLQQTRTSLRTKRKGSTESASSNISSTSVSLSSSSYAKKGAISKRASESQKVQKVQTKKKKKSFVPTENHMKLRRVEEAGEKWESELESIHGFTDGECCIIMGIIATHSNGKTEVFPAANGDRYLQHAKEGWEIQKEFNRLIKLYPECLADQRRVNGEWVQR